MNSSSNIDSLREALRLSPDNEPLRQLFIDSLIQAQQYDEAKSELKALVKSDPNNVGYRSQLAHLHYNDSEISEGIVLIEDLVREGSASTDTSMLFVRLLLEERDLEQAAEIYKKLKSQDRSVRDPEIEKQLMAFLEDEEPLRKASPPNYSGEEEDEADDSLIIPVEKPDITFKDVGGMSAVKEEISFKIIKPLKHAELFSQYGKKVGGGILLYGPPGCGKTYISKATAGEIESAFIAIGIHDVLDMWIGQSEGNLHAYFEYARRNTPSVLFFDEVDALGASRADLKKSSSRQLINQFLMEMDGVHYSNDGVLILAATNAPWHLDPAFKRPGRFDRIIFVPPPDHEARISILKLLLQDKPVKEIDYEGLAKRTKDFSGADLKALVDIAVEDLLKDILKNDIEEPLTMKRFKKALKMIKPSTKDWFQTAKNYAVYSNQSGIYDEITKYMGL